MAHKKSKIIRICAVLMPTLAMLSLLYWLRIRPSVGGVDFLCYLLTARDLAMGFGESLSRYFYYPGVYEFWRTSYLLANGKIALIQGHYVSVVILNGALVSLILWRTCKDIFISLFGLICYLALATSLEGMYGVTEPIGTLPVLFALFFIFPTSRLTWPQLILLGLALSASVFTKQQCGLIAMGVLGLLIAESSGEMPRQRKVISFLLRGLFITTVSTLGLIAFFHLEGSGLTGLLTGLNTVSNYPSSGSPLLHLLWLQKASHGFFALFIVTATLTLCTKRAYKNLKNSNLILFCIFAVLFSLLQLWKRGYLHYSLIPLPFLVLAISASVPLLNWSWLANLWQNKLPRLKTSANEIKNVTVTAMAVYLIVVTGVISGLFKPVPPSIVSNNSPFLSICKHLKPGADVFVFPPQFNEVHWLCQTRLISSPLSYGWSPVNRHLLTQIISSSTLTAVVLVKNQKQELLEQQGPIDFFVHDLQAALNEKALKVIDTPIAKIYLQDTH